jgi:pSer/pThr/pTyr-binding forkhead associated (FHA) protein
MNYILQVVRGRSASTTLKLTEGVTSIGRHDDCTIRIKSSQVSRRHCEIVDADGKLTIRDLGSSNGTFVNGKRINGQQALKPGDEVALGAVTLQVARLGQVPPVQPGSPVFKPPAGDTAVVEAIPPAEQEDEFEMEFDDGEVEPLVEGIPLADDQPTTVIERKPAAKAGPAAAAAAAPTPTPAPKASASKEDDAIAEFLLDLNIDEEE